MCLMERLNFVLPDFTRIIWVSEQARNSWEPRIMDIKQAWNEIEWLSVVYGVRRCAVNVVKPEDLVTRTAQWAGHGLHMLPVHMHGLSQHSYSSTLEKYKHGEPFLYRIVIGKAHDVLRFREAWAKNDGQEMGELLGYPACCSDFFSRVWVVEGHVDTTWPMAYATVNGSEQNGTCIEVSGNPHANILWRWMGVRSVPHLPCRFDCEGTIKFGEDLLSVGRKAGYNQEMDDLLKILSWPVEWSALHGIAEIKTPILKVCTRTDATSTKYVVRRLGVSYPEEGAVGLDFPYRMVSKVDSGVMPENSCMKVAEKVHGCEQEWYYRDNGFTSLPAMEEAHLPILELAKAELGGSAGNVLDIGAGNGALLKKIYEANSRVSVFGVEIEPTRVEHARQLMPAFADNFVVGDMFDCDSVWDGNRLFSLVILMVGRFLKVDQKRSANLMKHIREQCNRLLVYAYPDWIARYGSLENVASKAGVRLLPGSGYARLAEV